MGEIRCSTGLSYYSVLDFLHFSLEKCVKPVTLQMSLKTYHTEQKDDFPLSSDYLAHTSIKPHVIPDTLQWNSAGSPLPWHVTNLSWLSSADLPSHYFSFCTLNFTYHKTAYNHTCSAICKVASPYLQFVKLNWIPVMFLITFLASPGVLSTN